MPTYLGKIGAKDFRLISKSIGLGSHRAWRRQYANYSNAVLRSDIGWMKDFANRLTENEKAGLLRLYRSGDTLARRIRTSVFCCPYCGIQSNVTVDHYLPKDVFPQFSVFSLNLVPACSDCQNKGHKGTKHPERKRRINPSPARFIHPYLDKFLRDCVIEIQFTSGERISGVRVVAKKGSARARRILKYHIDTLKLSERSVRHVDRVWNQLLRHVAGNIKYAERQNLVSMLIERREDEAFSAGSLNAIVVAFISSLISSDEGIKFLMQKAQGPRITHLNKKLAAGRW